MSYLNKKNWRKLTFSSGGSRKKKAYSSVLESPGTRKAGTIICLLAFLFFVPHILALFAEEEIGLELEKYIGSITEVRAEKLKKPLDLMINMGVDEIFDKPYTLGDVISIIPTGEGSRIGSDLDVISFTLLNQAKWYLSRNAHAFIWPSIQFKLRKLKGGEKAVKRIKMGKGTGFAGKNWGMGFSIVPNSKFSHIANVRRESTASSVFMAEPYFFQNQGLRLLSFQRKFGDGKVRTIKANDSWVALRPNTFGKFRQNKNVPVVPPNRALMLAYYIFTDLCDLETGEWDLARTQWLAAKDLNSIYGADVNPADLKVMGKGPNSRLINTKPEKMPKEFLTTWYKNQHRGRHNTLMSVPVASMVSRSDGVKNAIYDNEVCVYGSMRADQSILIPLKWLRKWGNDEEIVLLEGQIVTNFTEILDECQQARDNSRGKRRINFEVVDDNNRSGRSRRINSADFSFCVVKTPRLREIANRAIGNSRNRYQAFSRLSDLASQIRYVSDFHENLDNANYRGPNEVWRTPLLAFLNGDDCEGHAVVDASLALSSDHKALGGDNEVGLARLTYYGEGHVIPLFPNLGVAPETDPFPNHYFITDSRGNKRPFFTVEPTGLGDDPLHSISPDEKGYRTLAVKVIGSKEGWINYSQLDYVLTKKTQG